MSGRIVVKKSISEEDEAIGMALQLTSEFGTKDICDLSFTYTRDSRVMSVNFMPMIGSKSPFISIEVFGERFSVSLKPTSHSDKSILDRNRSLSMADFREFFEKVKNKSLKEKKHL